MQRLKEVGHWDELVVVGESAEIPELSAQLEPLPHQERVRAVEEEERFQTWALCRWMLLESRREAFADGQRAVDWAALALRIATHLGEEYGEGSVAAIRAEALATLGNAHRVLDEFRVAEECFLAAEELLDRMGDGDLLLMAEVQNLKASLRLDQRRFAEARGLVRRALTVFREQGERQKVGKLLLLESKIMEEEGDLGTSAEILRRASGEIDSQAEPGLFRMTRFNLLGVLVRLGPSSPRDWGTSSCASSPRTGGARRPCGAASVRGRSKSADHLCLCGTMKSDWRREPPRSFAVAGCGRTDDRKETAHGGTSLGRARKADPG